MSDVNQPNENQPTPETGEAAAHESIVDATDAPADQPQAGLERAKDELNRAGDNLAKAAAEAAYATIGLVGLVSDRVKEFYADQKRQYSEAHPEFEGDPEAREVLSRFGEQVDRFIGEVGDTFRSLAERGRATSQSAAEATNQMAEEAEAAATHLAESAQRAAAEFVDEAGDATDRVTEEVESQVDRDEREHQADAG